MTSETEGTSFFAALGECFRKAAARIGSTTHQLEVANRRVTLEIAGEKLAQLLLPALCHLSIPPAAMPVCLHLFAWDESSSGCAAPRPPFGTAPHRNRGDLVSPPGEALRLHFPIDAGVLECFLPGTQLAYCWVRDVDTLGPAQRAVPFRSIWGWWGAEIGSPMVHAAAVASEFGGALLTAPGGSGKSTTAVECLLGGLRFAGDDTVLVGSSATGWRAASLFGTARIAIGRLDDYPSIHRLVDGRQDKGTLLFEPSHRKLLARSLPIDVLLVPRLRGQQHAALRPLRGADVLRALAPHSVFLVAGAGSDTLACLARLAREVPAYELELGPLAAENVAAVQEAIRRHGSAP